MPVTPGQAKMLSMLMATRELDPEVIEATNQLLNHADMSFDECNDLIAALVKAPDNGEEDFVIGGVAKG